MVYDINKNVFTITSKTENSDVSDKTRPKPNLVSYTVIDTLGQNLVLCIPNNNSVLIALISYVDSSKTNYVLKGVFRFNEFGLDDGNQTPNNVIADYYKLFWNSSDTKDIKDIKEINNNQKYMFKTQIVPPVCPTCPTCPSTGLCTNCGGTGGSGTLSKKGNTVVTGTKPNSPGSTITDVAKAGAGVLTGVAGTIGGVANNLISTTGSILKPNQSGGIQNNGPNQPNALNQRSTPGYSPPGVGTNNQYSDPYSYYGQLPPKGKTNYIPVTADFSRFGR
jgi:hypothetical protein